MKYTALETSPLFAGIPAEELSRILQSTAHQIQRYEKGETVFFLMDEATRVGVVLEGHVQAQKAFPNGSQVDVSLMGPGEVIGAAAVFSAARKYPCDLVATEPAAVLMLCREDLLQLMQRNARVMENLMAEIASAAYMLQQRLELLSYSGIAQKAAFWLLTQARQTGSIHVRIPESISRWAAMMNVSRPSLHRELRRMAEKGIIRYNPPCIDICSPEELQKVLE